MRRELDKLLAAVADEADDELTWDAADLELIHLLMAASTGKCGYLPITQQLLTT